MTTPGITLKKIVRTAAPALAGGAIALTAVVGSAAPANAAPPALTTTVAKTTPAATPQVTSCFADRDRVPYYSWPDWRDRGQVNFKGWAGRGQGIYWYGTTFVNGYAYVVGTLWGGPSNMMMPRMYLRC